MRLFGRGPVGDLDGCFELVELGLVAVDHGTDALRREPDDVLGVIAVSAALVLGILVGLSELGEALDEDVALDEGGVDGGAVGRDGARVVALADGDPDVEELLVLGIDGLEERFDLFAGCGIGLWEADVFGERGLELLELFLHNPLAYKQLCRFHDCRWRGRWALSAGGFKGERAVHHVLKNGDAAFATGRCTA